MQYFGGKSKISKYLVDFLENVRKENQHYLEPFCGGCSVISKMSGNRTGCDLNEYIIELYNQIQNGLELPDNITEEQYNYIKNNKDENKAITGFVGFGCSFAGKWFGGYARGHDRKLGYAYTAKKSLLKKFRTMKDVVFQHFNYKDLDPNYMLIYCDPPYKNTTKFNGVENFDSEKFWQTMRIWSKNNDVYISEYEAPDDFECVLEINTKTDIRSKDNKQIKRTEKLFKYKGDKNIERIKNSN